MNKAISRKLIFFLLLLVFAWIAITHFGQTKNIVNVLAAGKWYWIALATLCQLFFYPFYTHFISFIFNLFGAKIQRRNIMQVYLASKFTDVALPLATFGKIAVFVRNGKRHNITPLNAGIGISFVLLFDIVGFVAFTAITLLLLTMFDKNQPYLLVTFLILFAIVSITILFLIQLSLFKTPPNRLVLWIIKHIVKLTGKNSTDMADIEKIFLEIGADLVRGNKKILNGFWLAFGAHIINFMTFLFIYLAFAGHLNILAVLAGFVAGLLYTIVSITPQGVGVAEAVMVATLHSFGLDISVAAAITLAYRGLLYWLPLFIGFYFFSRLEFKKTLNN